MFESTGELGATCNVTPLRKYLEVKIHRYPESVPRDISGRIRQRLFN